MTIPYYPGCTLKTTAKNFEDSAIGVFKTLDLELKELKRWNCCGTVYSLAADDLMHHLAPIRNLIRVKEEGGDRVVTLCSMCYNTLKRSNLRISQNEDDRQKINDFMDREEVNYEGDVQVLHGLEILKGEIGFERVGQAVKRPLEGLKVAPYYGCLLLRPDEVGIDDSENPTILEDLIRALGAEPIDFPYRNECCGAYHTVNEPQIVADKAYAIMECAKSMEADVVVTSCPLCQFNLDTRQRDVKKKYPGFMELPALYFTQLMAVAFGLPTEVCRFDLNYVSPEEVFKDLTVVQ
jgi:heterodisulfide reductase subunit B